MKELIERNKLIRENRPLVPTDVLYTTYEHNGVFQICFKSKGCVNYLHGFCIMCDYGVGVNISPQELSLAFDEALKESKEEIRVLLLNSFGSVLDEREISEECFIMLLEKIKNTSIKNIIFETHYTTINQRKLDLIKSVLGDRNIIFELGLETSDSQVRQDCLLKYIDNRKFVETIKLIHSYNMKVIANVLIGIPFLSEEQQVKNALDSIIWCFNNQVDEVDLFPMNIRPFTLLQELYLKEEYKLISHWMVIEVLSLIPKNYLSEIYIAWYGNRDLKYEDNLHSIFPTSCSGCEQDLINFYELFLKNKDPDYRKFLINDLIKNKHCGCYKRILKK